MSTKLRNLCIEHGVGNYHIRPQPIAQLLRQQTHCVKLTESVNDLETSGAICINLYQSISISLSLFISIYINSCLISIQSVSLVDWTPTPQSASSFPGSSGNFSHLLIPTKVSANGVGLISHPGIGALAIGKPWKICGDLKKIGR